METWCWDEALKLYNNTMLTAAAVWWHWLWHQCEEDVGDDIIHRRLKHSDYFRLGKEKEKEPWWRHLSFYKALRYFKIGRMRKPAERADHELHRYTSSSPARWSSVTCSDLMLMFCSCRHVRQLQAETQHLRQRRQERSEEQTEEVHHQTSVHEDAAGERTHQRSLLRLYSLNHQHMTLNKLLGCLNRSIFSGH